MRRFICSFLVAAFVGGMLQGVALARVWTDSTGSKKLEADYVGKKDGHVVLRLRDGSVESVPIERLSAEDQKHVAGLPDIVAPTRKPEPVEAAAPVETDRFTKAIEQNPNDHSAYYTRGMARLNQGRYSEAMADFNKSSSVGAEVRPRL